MSVRAYILVNIEPGKVMPVVERLARLQGVTEAYLITGEYDAIVHAVVSDVREVNRMMIQKIHEIEGVRDTNTHIVLA